MLLLGNEEKPLILTWYESGKLGYKTNEQDYTLERSGVSQPSEEVTETSLIDGFKGKWCDTDQMPCFEIVFDDDENGGYFHYYQEREPYQERFRIPYMDEFEIEIEFKAASSQVTLSLDDNKESMTYVSDFNTATMTKQQ